MRINSSIRLLVLLCAAQLLSGRLAAQLLQQGPKLVGIGAIGSSQHGFSVAVSTDGNTMIAGATSDNSNAGAAWIWTKSGGVWMQQAKLVGSGAVGAATQGSAVALSADGNTAIVGGPLDNAFTGAVWVWARSGGVWTQQGSKLVGSGATPDGANQGVAVSLSADGNTAIVGGSGDNTFVGAAWVWTRSGGVWSQQGNKLVGTGHGLLSAQGISVSLSADGNTAIVGGNFDNNNTGAAWVWSRSGTVWAQQGSKLVGSGASGPAEQGFSVAVAQDGNTALVGGRDDNSGVGAVWVWTRNGAIWTQQGAKLVGAGVIGAASQGDSVFLSADGNTAIIGGPSDTSNAGAAWIWMRNGGIWSSQSKLIGSGAAGSSQQGSSVALSGDGKIAVVGGPFDNSKAGAVWVFSATSSPRRHAVNH